MTDRVRPRDLLAGGRRRRWKNSATPRNCTAASAATPRSRPASRSYRSSPRCSRSSRSGFSLGGPAFFFTWPIVFVCQFCVCLVFAELSGKFPVAGAIYQWSRRLAGNAVGWFAGWFMLIGYIVSIAALAIAMQTVLPPIWSGFQIIGGDMDPLSVSGADERHHPRHASPSCCAPSSAPPAWRSWAGSPSPA